LSHRGRDSGEFNGLAFMDVAKSYVVGAEGVLAVIGFSDRPPSV
jgi:hypothetical protein